MEEEELEEAEEEHEGVGESEAALLREGLNAKHKQHQAR